jgi:hypothetical protein
LQVIERACPLPVEEQGKSMLEGGHYTAKRLLVSQLQFLVLLVDVSILKQNGIERRRTKDCHDFFDYGWSLLNHGVADIKRLP